MPATKKMRAAAGGLERHAARLEKWSMTETVALERMLAQYFKRGGAANGEEFLAVLDTDDSRGLSLAISVQSYAVYTSPRTMRPIPS